MRATNHLTWVEAKEFGGLWTAGESTLMPSSAAQVMSGCHPQPGGGLRGFLKPAATVAGTGLASTYLNLTGAAGSYASTPDSESSTTSNTIVMDVSLADWTPAAPSIICSDLVLAAFTGMEVRVTSGGNLEFLYGNGASNITMTSTAVISSPAYGPPTADRRLWLRVTWVGSSGGSRRANFYVSDSGDPDDWTQIGTEVTGSVDTMSPSAAAWTVGARPDGSGRMTGKAFHVLSGPTGWLATAWTATGDFENQVAAATSWTSRSSEVWTVNSPAALVSQGTPARVAVGLGVTALAPASAPAGHLLYLVTIGDPAAPGDADDWQMHFHHHDGAGFDTAVKWRHFWGRFRGAAHSGQAPPPAAPMFATLGQSGTFLSNDYVSLAPRSSGGGTSSGGGAFHLKFDGSTTMIDRVTSGAFDPNYGLVSLVEHQARLVAGYRDQVVFTNPGGVDWDTVDGGGFVTVNPKGWFSDDGVSGSQLNETALIAWMVSVPPGDLLVATRDGRVYNIQGDLGDPTVRELGRWAPQISQVPTNTSSGVFFIMPNSGVHRMGVDGAMEHISPGLDPTQWGSFDPAVGLGSLAGTERYLFAPNQSTAPKTTNGPLVYDFLTKAWFTATHVDQTVITSPRLMALETNPSDAGVWVVPNVTLTGSNSTAFKYRTGNGPIAGGVMDEPRNAIWEYTSAPFRDPGLNQVDVRQVVLPSYAWNAASTIAVTVDGVTVTKTLPAGRSVQTFSFRARGDALDVNILSKSNDGDVEAPMIEAFRVGYKSGPLQGW